MKGQSWKKNDWLKVLLPCLFLSACQTQRLSGYEPSRQTPFIKSIDYIDSLHSGNWVRSFRTEDGTIYLHGKLKSTDNGKTIVPQNDIDLEEITAKPERAVLSDKGIFYALDGETTIVSPGVYGVKAWRSTDGLKTLQNGTVNIYVPGGPERISNGKDWFGIFIYRRIIEMPDGSWLLTMYGNFKDDTLLTTDGDAKREAKYMARVFVVSSADKGRSWHYLSSIAIPHAGDPVGEGFGEPAITRLQDGRLLCIMRSGHHFPLYASWSADNGKTWTAPLYTGLDRGCDPCLITLADGRVLLSWGKRFPEGWSKVTPEGDKGAFRFPGEGYITLSISDDGGLTWASHKILKRAGTCYSTIFEVAPNLIFCQADQVCMRVKLRPAG
jgi:hypothetical protein